jgi:hypothetical protein
MTHVSKYGDSRKRKPSGVTTPEIIAALKNLVEVVNLYGLGPKAGDEDYLRLAQAKLLLQMLRESKR